MGRIKTSITRSIFILMLAAPILTFQNCSGHFNANTSALNTQESSSSSTNIPGLPVTSSSPTPVSSPAQAATPTRFVSPSGNDANSGTSLNSAWKTIQHAANVAVSGDVVSIQPGTYKESPNFTKSGNALSSISFVGSGTAACSAGNLKGLCPTTTILGNVTVSGDYIALDNLTISPPGAISSSVYGTSLDGNYDTVVNSLFTNFGATASDQATMLVMDGTFDTVQNCSFRDQNDIDVFHVWGHDQKIIGNYVTNIQEVNYNLNHTDFVQTWLGTSYNVLIDSNVVTNSTCQLGNTETDGSSDDHDWTISNNVFVNVTNPFFSGLPNTRFYNNFFYNVGSNDAYPISFYTNTTPGNQRSSVGSDVANNIFVKSGSPIGNGGDAAPMEDNIVTNTDPAYIDLNSGAETGAAPAILIGKGANESKYFTSDKADSTRPAMGAWTLGPYQN